MKTLNLNQKSETIFLVRNHVEEDELKVCFPLSSKRAGCVKKAKKVFLCVAGYFEKEISETLILYQKVGLDENGRDKFEKIAYCVVHKGNREVIEFTPKTVNS